MTFLADFIKIHKRKWILSEKSQGKIREIAVKNTILIRWLPGLEAMYQKSKGIFGISASKSIR